MVETQDIKKGYKQTAVGLIPEEWSLRKIEDLFGFIRTNSLSRSSLNYDYFENNIFNIHYGDIHSTYQTSILNFDIEQGIPVVSADDFTPNNADFLIEGDVVIADASEDYEGVGKAIEIQNIKGRKVLAGLHTFALRGKTNETALGFRTYLFKHPKVSKAIKVIATGTKVYGVSKSNFATLNVILPPLPEQQKIAKILSTWDDAITLTKTTIEELKLRNKGLAQQLLTGKKRLKDFSGEWKEVKLGDCFIERNETNFTELELLSVGEQGVYPQSESNKKDTSNSDKAKYKRICPGDIGYNTMRMWQGRSALSSIEGIVSPAYTIVTPKQNSHSNYFSFLFKQEEIIHRFYRKSQGLVSDTLNCKFKDFKKVRVIIPNSKEEQIAIAEVLKNGIEEIKIQQQKLETLQIQKKGLMQKLLTGEVRVEID